MTVFLQNRAPTKSVNGITPYYAWYDKQPAVHFLRTFGCIALFKVVQPNLKKLEDRSRPTVFLGYVDGSKAYKCYDPVTKQVHVTHDVVFDEEAKWDWQGTSTSTTNYNDVNTDFTVEYLVDTGNRDSHAVGAGNTNMLLRRSRLQLTWATPTCHRHQTRLVKLSLFPHRQAPHRLLRTKQRRRYRPFRDLLDSTAITNPDVTELLMASKDEPMTFAEKDQAEPWKRAMLNEMSSIEENNT